MQTNKFKNKKFGKFIWKALICRKKTYMFTESFYNNGVIYIAAAAGNSCIGSQHFPKNKNKFICNTTTQNLPNNEIQWDLSMALTAVVPNQT